MSKEAELWARFDVGCGHSDLFHLMISDLSFASVCGVEVACGKTILSKDDYLDDVLVEASRMVEHRKKCRYCYDYWMKRRKQRQQELPLNVKEATDLS